MIDFTNMTRDEALNMRVDLDVARWGEAEREASRRAQRGRSVGLLINGVVYHQMNDFGDKFSAAEKKAAKGRLTEADKAELRKGG